MIPDSIDLLDDASTMRRKAFVDAARELFFANGYAGTTMSSIARKVGGSKTTLWTYFPSKEDLFAAVVDDIAESYGASILQVELPVDAPVMDVLRHYARTLIGALTSDPLLALYRLVVGEARRFPHLAETFYERGPRRGKARLAIWMAEKMTRGELRPGDPIVAVQQFTGLCQSGLYQITLLNLLEAKRESARFLTEIDAAIDSFHRAWGPDSPTKAP
jgi:AcrR family transcriptional regulator